MKKKSIIITFMSILMSFSLLGCTKEVKSSKQEFSYYEENGLVTVDPQLSQDDAGMTIVNNVFEGLFGTNEKGQIIALGATEVPKIKKNQQEVSVKLRDSHWSNGEKVTTADYMYAFQRAIDLNSPYRSLFKMFKNGEQVIDGTLPFSAIGIKSVDNNTIVFEMETYEEDFLKILTMPVFFPIYNKIDGSKDLMTSTKTLVYNGPFTLEPFKGERTSLWKLKKNTNYWDKKNVQLEKITGQVEQSVSLRQSKYNQGKAQLIPVKDYSWININQDPEYVQQSYNQVGFLIINLDSNNKFNNELKDIIYYSTNRQKIVNWALTDYSYPSLSIFSLKSKATLKNWKENNWDYDLEKTKKIAESNDFHSNSLMLRIITINNSSYRKIADSIQESLETNISNCQVSVESLSSQDYFEKLKNKDYDLAVASSLPIVTSEKWYLEVINDTLLNNMLTIPNLSDYQKFAEKELINTRCIDPLYQKENSFLVSEKVKGIQINSSGAKLYLKNAYCVN